MVLTGSARILWAVGRALWRREVPRHAALSAMVDAVTGSFFLVCLAVGFVGASMCWQAAWQARRVLGDQSFIGPEFLVIMVNEFTPIMVGTMLAARGGAGLAARLATRRTTLQADAVTLMGDDPVRLFAVPEVLGAFTAALTLAPPALVAGEVAGIITMKTAFQVEPLSFVAFDALTAGDLVFSMVKSVTFAVAVTVLGAQAGMAARPGAAGVGDAAMTAVVNGSLGVLTLDALLDALRFGLGWP